MPSFVVPLPELQPTGFLRRSILHPERDHVKVPLARLSRLDCPVPRKTIAERPSETGEVTLQNALELMNGAIEIRRQRVRHEPRRLNPPLIDRFEAPHSYSLGVLRHAPGA